VVAGLVDIIEDDSASSHLEESTDPHILDKQTVELPTLDLEDMETSTGTIAQTEHVTDPIMNLDSTEEGTFGGQSNYMVW